VRGLRHYEARMKLIAVDTHLMPTRYTLELENLKGVVSADTFKEVSQREDAKKTVKKAFEERYTSGKNRWFFTPLQF
jgi:large subunit ribosomal protein L27e